MYKEELQIREQIPIKRIINERFPLIVFYLLLKIYLPEDSLFSFSAKKLNLDKVNKRMIIKC
jgi:hypothetical protein